MWNYINPISRLGIRKYSSRIPSVFTLLMCGLLEYVFVVLLNNPSGVGIYAIIFPAAAIIYFSFRDGIKGGMIVALITIIYYFYIIETRNYTGARLQSSINATIVLAIIYSSLAYVIGWLKERVDLLIDNEAQEKRRLRQILEQLPVGVVILTKKGRVELSNHIAQEIIERDPEINLMKDIKNLIQSGNTELIEKEYQINQGFRITLQLTGNPIMSNTGLVKANAVIINDITSQKEMERRKDDFVNMASHELKTPITSIKLYVRALKVRLEKNAPSLLKIVSNVESQTEKLQKLVSDLLDVSRLQTGKLEINKEYFYLDELVKENVEVLNASAPHHKILIKSDEKINIFADKFRIYQVITNIISNAIKYSPKNTSITVMVKKKGNEGIVKVIDQGIGISKDQHDKIFQRLYQVEGDAEKTFPGFGMGLYISKEIVSRHGGNIQVDSKKGQGSAFTISLPLGHQ